MTKMTKALLAGAAMAALGASAPLLAQASKVATINGAEAIFRANALTTAMQQIEAKYAAQIKGANDRQAQLQAQLKPLYDALDTNKDGNLDENEQRAAIQAQRPQIKQIQDAEVAANTAIEQSMRPVQLAQMYVFDQLSQRYNTALDNQIRTKQIGLILPGTQVVRTAPGTDLTATVRTEIDKPLTIDPPANWQPTQAGAALLQTYAQAVQEAQQRQAAAAAAQQRQGAQPAAPATTNPATPRPAAPAPTREPGR